MNENEMALLVNKTFFIYIGTKNDAHFLPFS